MPISRYSYHRLRTEPWQHPPAGRPATECRGSASDPPCRPRRGGGARPRPTRAARRPETAAPRTGLAGADPSRRRLLPRPCPARHISQSSSFHFSLSAHLSCTLESRQKLASIVKSVALCYYYHRVICYLLWRWRTKFRVGGNQNLQEKKRIVKRGRRETVSCVLLVSRRRMTIQ